MRSRSGGPRCWTSSRIPTTPTNPATSCARSCRQVLLFIAVPDGEKKLKNRLHFDLRPVDGTRDQEVERLLALGASQVGDFRRPDGRGWITLTDPEGNEFCVLPRYQATSNPIS
jgi:Glyoxalase-like domain